MFVSEIRAQYVDENDLFRTVLKRIYEEWDAAQNRWHLKKVAFIFCEPEYPVPSDHVNVAVEARHGWGDSAGLEIRYGGLGLHAEAGR